MAVALVQSTGIQTGSSVGNGANADTASFGSLPAVNNHVIVGVGSWNNDLTIIGLDGVSDNQGNSYTLRINKTNLSYDVYSSLADCKVATSAGTFTVGLDPTSANNYMGWNASEFSGLDTSSWADQSGTNDSATGDANATASGANSTNDGLAIGVCAVNNNDSDINIDDTPPSGYTNLAFYNDGASIVGFSMVYKIYSAGETSSVQWTHDNTSQTGWTAGVQTYKAAGGGGGGSATHPGWMNNSGGWF